MSFPKRSNGFPVVPKGEAKCIWMMAGVIGYKLCDHDYQCEQCPLDMELRHASEEGLTPSRRILEKPDDDQEGMLESLFYYPNHTWVRVEGSNNATVGLDDFIIKLLATIKRIVLVTPGNQILRGEGLALIIQDDNTFIITSPISGRVTEVNIDLMQHPDFMTLNPRENSWLVQVLPTHLLNELRDLLVGRKALAWQQEESKKLESVVSALGEKEREALGPIMHDGKAKLNSLLEIVGPDRYHKILTSFLKANFK